MINHLQSNLGNTSTASVIHTQQTIISSPKKCNGRKYLTNRGTYKAQPSHDKIYFIFSLTFFFKIHILIWILLMLRTLYLKALDYDFSLNKMLVKEGRSKIIFGSDFVINIPMSA